MELVNDPAMDKDILAYRRRDDDQTILVAINFGSRFASLHLATEFPRVLLSVGMEPSTTKAKIQIPPYAGIVIGE